LLTKHLISVVRLVMFDSIWIYLVANCQFLQGAGICIRPALHMERVHRRCDGCYSFFCYQRQTTWGLSEEGRFWGLRLPMSGQVKVFFCQSRE